MHSNEALAWNTPLRRATLALSFQDVSRPLRQAVDGRTHPYCNRMTKTAPQSTRTLKPRPPYQKRGWHGPRGGIVQMYGTTAMLCRHGPCTHKLPGKIPWYEGVPGNQPCPTGPRCHHFAVRYRTAPYGWERYRAARDGPALYQNRVQCCRLALFSARCRPLRYCAVFRRSLPPCVVRCSAVLHCAVLCCAVRCLCCGCRACFVVL
jgi:hypothetical protein